MALPLHYSLNFITGHCRKRERVLLSEQMLYKVTVRMYHGKSCLIEQKNTNQNNGFLEVLGEQSQQGVSSGV